MRQKNSCKISRTGINQYSGKEPVFFIEEKQMEEQYEPPKPNNEVVKIQKPKKPQKSKFQK